MCRVFVEELLAFLREKGEMIDGEEKVPSSNRYVPTLNKKQFCSTCTIHSQRRHFTKFFNFVHSAVLVTASLWKKGAFLSLKDTGKIGNHFLMLSQKELVTSSNLGLN